MPATESAISSIHLDLLEELPVLPAATTSRVLVNNEYLRHVLFSFGAGQELTEHATPRAVIVQLLTGELEMTLNHNTYLMRTADAIYLAPNEPHSLIAKTDCHIALTMVPVRKDDHND